MNYVYYFLILSKAPLYALSFTFFINENKYSKGQRLNALRLTPHLKRGQTPRLAHSKQGDNNNGDGFLLFYQTDGQRSC